VFSASGSLPRGARIVVRGKRRTIFFLFLLLALGALTARLALLQESQDTPDGPSPVSKGSSFYASYWGGAAKDFIRDIYVDTEGFIYVTGGAGAPNFPTTEGAYDESFNGTMDVFVTKLSPAGGLVCSTFIGGPEYDRAYALEVDRQGNIYVGGRAGAGYPTTRGVVQPQFRGDVTPNALYGTQDGFVTKLSNDCSRVLWSTYFGTAEDDIVRDIALDDRGNVFIASTGVSAANPSPFIIAEAFQSAVRGDEDGLVASISSDGKRVLYATYIGGSGNDGGTPSVRIDSQGNAYYLMETRSLDAPVSATAYQRQNRGTSDLHLSKLSPDGRQLLFGTYFGGSRAEVLETHNLSLDRRGNAYLAAMTTSSDLAVSAGAFQRSYGGGGRRGAGRGTNYAGDAFVAKISADGSRLLASTYLGGAAGEGLQGASVDPEGNVFVSGTSFSSDVPLTSNAFQEVQRGRGDAWIAKLSPDLSKLLFSTLVGGSDFDELRSLDIDSRGNVYSAGHTPSTNFPSSTDAAQRSSRGSSEGILVKVNLGQ
jgi:hypothetical protein